MVRLAASFQFHLGSSVEIGLVTVGKYDGRQASLTCATSGGKVLIHNPHDRAMDHQPAVPGAQKGIRFLNINKRITALRAGNLAATGGEAADVLLIGTPSNLMAYDVEKNHDVFYKDVPDGVSAVIVGKGPMSEEPLAFVGGNYSIQGFNREGAESFWTVTGDNVGALAFCDMDGDGVAELVVGSDDFEVRVFKQEEVVLEITEADRVTHLHPFGGGGGCAGNGKPATRWGYGLANGTVGVYERGKRVWRAKTRHAVTAMASFDIDGDGVEELICGFDSGSLVARNAATGEVVYKDSLPAAVAGIVCADYRQIGRDELLAVSADGEVRGYEPTPPPPATAGPGESSGACNHSSRTRARHAQDSKTIEALQRRKQELSMELASLVEANKNRRAGGRLPGTISASTMVSATLCADTESGTLELVLSTGGDAVISSAVAADADGRLFNGEPVVGSAATPSPQLRLRLPPSKNQAGVLRIQAMVGPRGFSSGLYVLDTEIAVPKFAGFVQTHGDGGGGDDSGGGGGAGADPEPGGCLTFAVPEQPSRVAMWVAQSFVLEQSAPSDNGARGQAESSWRFLSVAAQSGRRGGDGGGGRREPLWLECRRDGGTAVTVRCDDVRLVGEVVQDLCKFLQVQELESVADFPEEMENFAATLQRVTDHDSLRLRLSADTADYSQRVKALVVRAEDCRLLGDMPLMTRTYAELIALNRQLVSEHAKRANNQAALLEALKEVNAMIQKAASLRMGKAKARVVAEMRAAVRDRNTQALLQIITQGKDPHERSGGGGEEGSGLK